MEKKKQTLSMAKVRQRKSALRKLKLSLREIAKMYGNEITFQTLGRFIREKNYIPKDERVCRLLDLYRDPNPFRILPRWYKRTHEALAFFNAKREQIKSIAIEARKQSRYWR